MAFPTAILANALAPFLTGRCTLESPVAGGGWTTVATGVPCQMQALPSGLVAAMAPFSGGVSASNRWRVWLPGTQAAAAQWRVTNEATGQRYTVEDDNRPATDQAFTILDVRGA